MTDLATAAAAPPRAPRPQAWLDSPVAEAASVALFAAGGGLMAAAPGATPPALLFGLAAALVGLAAQGVERGEARRLGWGPALGLALLAAGVQVAVVALVAHQPPAPLLAGSACVVLVLGPVLARWASRFDRQEQGWRDACRRGPPAGSSPLAQRIAALDLPKPVSWILLPVSIVLRIPCLAAILAYQLTFSRLMPPACRYEPSCSRYGFGAFLRFGIIRGSLLTGLRLLRCSPIGSGGYDPMPPCSGDTPRPGDETW